MKRAASAPSSTPGTSPAAPREVRGEGEHLLDLRFGVLLLEDDGVAAVVGLEEGVDGSDRRRLTVHPVHDQTSLYNKINFNGNSKISNGDEVLLERVTTPVSLATTVLAV